MLEYLVLIPLSMPITLDLQSTILHFHHVVDLQVGLTFLVVIYGFR